MKKKNRRNFTAEFKARVAWEAAHGATCATTAT